MYTLFKQNLLHAKDGFSLQSDFSLKISDIHLHFYIACKWPQQHLCYFDIHQVVSVGSLASIINRIAHVR